DASYLFPYGPYSIKLLLKYIPGKYVVVNSPVTAIHVGDEIVSVDGLTTIQWEDSLKPYVSAGDSDAFRKSVASDMLCGTYSANINVVFKDSTGASHTLPMPRGQSPGNSYFSSYFPNDTLANVQWKHWTNCNTGYINLSTMQDSGVFSAYQNLRTCSTLILDLRCAYPVSYTYNTLANYMLPGPKAYSSFLFPDPTYPGTFSVGSNQAGYSGNPEPYAGKVILLLNEQTQFQSEDAALIFETLPHVLKIGSPTNASDGNEIYYSISQNLQAGFNGYAIYDALGDSLERVGILPDIVMYPTQTGIRHHRDELLERALTASCVTGIELLEKPLPCIRIYPNPSSGIVTLVASFIPGRKQLVIHTMLGETIYRASLLQDDSVIDLSAFPPGMYLFSVYNTDGTFSSNGKLLIH
ncbi:MAG TPA: T9SS type A sorting domain-containing protein, partial [Bacteroidia bacterium]|nr:T9SS type A sorting domain-containing protein [Bacteroidia bacterium]